MLLRCYARRQRRLAFLRIISRRMELVEIEDGPPQRTKVLGGHIGVPPVIGEREHPERLVLGVDQVDVGPRSR
jgi:hypothetical protein